MRKAIIGGNWKMNTDRASGTALARAIAAGAKGLPGVEIAVFPPFVYLAEIGQVLAGSGGGVMLGAQDVFHAEKGAFTGEVSVGMLKDVGVQIVLCGHSERRHVMHEGDDLVNAKVNAVLNGGLRCVLCVGEKLEQRTTGQTNTVNERQVRMGVRHVTPDQLDRLVIAYEPVWAIGTGQTASPQDAQDAHAHIRSVLADEFGKEAAEKIRIQYGGSVTAANAAAIMGSAAVAAGADEARLEVVRRLVAQPDVDGGLVGGASLKADEFLAICRAVKQA